MGLYDNYRQSNSTRIPEFAGSVIPELKYAKEDLDAKYNLAKGTAERTEFDAKTAPVLHLKSDQDAYKSVMETANADLAAITARPDYENMVGLTRQVAQKTAMNLRPLRQRAEGRAAYAKSLDDKEKGLDATTKALLLKKADDDDQRYGKGIYRDEVTGELTGNYSGTEAAKAVDRVKKIDDAIKGAVPLKTGQTIEKSNGQYFIKSGNTRTVLTEGTIASILKSAYQMDPEWRAYDEQEAGLKGWAIGKNATKATFDNMSDTVLDAAGNPTPNLMKGKVAEAVAGGASYRDAFEAAGKEISLSSLEYNTFNYANKYKQNDWTTERGMSVDGYGLQASAQAHEDAKEEKVKEVIAYTSQSVSENTDPAIQSVKGLSAGLSTEAKNIDRYKKEIANLDADLKTPGRSEEQKVKIQSNINALNANLTKSREKFTQYKRVEQENREDATRRLYPGKTYSDIVDAGGTQLTEKLTKLYPSGSVKMDDGTVIPVAQLAKSIIKNGSKTEQVDRTNVQGNYVGKMDGKTSVNIIETNDKSPNFGKVIGTFTQGARDVSGGSGTKTENPMNNAIKGWKSRSELQRIEENVAANYKPKATITTAITIPDADANEIGKILKDMPAMDATGTVRKLPADVDWSKSKNATYNKDLNKLSITLYSTTGENLGNQVFDATSTDIRKVLGQKFKLRGSTEDIRQVGDDMETQLPQYVDERLKLNSYVTETSDGKKFYIQHPKTGKTVQAKFIRDNHNEYTIYSEGSILYRTKSKSEAGEWISQMEQGAQAQHAIDNK